MNNFNFYTPTRYVFGRGAEEQVGQLTSGMGARKVMVVYGKGSAVRSGLLARVKASLKQAAIRTVDLGGVQPNPVDTKVYEGITLARAEAIDGLVAVVEALSSTPPKP